MSSLTAQESSEANPSNPINEGTTSAPGTGSDPAVPFGTGAKSDSGFDAGLSSGTVDKVRFPHAQYQVHVYQVHGRELLMGGVQTAAGTQNASGSSEQRSGADLSQGSGDTGGKSGSASVLDGVEKSVHERGEAEHSRAV